MLAALGVGYITKVPGTDVSHWELIFSECNNFFEKPATPPENAIKHEVELLPDSVPPAKR